MKLKADFAKHHIEESFFQERFFEVQKHNEVMSEILEKSESLNIPQWAVGAGFLQQSLWNVFHERPLLENIKDVDWVYYNPNDLSEQSENLVSEKVRETFGHIPLKFDVKNQARVHLWYEKKFGYTIPPYCNLEHAITTWPTTATTVALYQVEGEIKWIAPFGFKDLVTMQIRPNKVQITKEIYEAKVTRWKKHWNKMIAEPW